MASTVTITAKIGPAIQATSLVLTGVTSVNYDLEKRVLEINQGGKITIYDLVGVTTVTFSISGANYTITVS